jgi:hypothetical protein
MKERFTNNNGLTVLARKEIRKEIRKKFRKEIRKFKIIL